MKQKSIFYQLLVVTYLIASVSLLAQEKDFISGQILIQLKPEASAKKASFKTQIQAKVLKDFPDRDFELWELTTRNKAQTLALIEQYKNHPDVAFIEPNYVWAIDDLKPNDPYFPKLWGLHNTGQRGGIEDVDLDLPESWCMKYAASPVVVGILDTGIDWTHEDLVDKIGKT